jgi:5-methyltetrahydrofolate--homocysteine methyltransferase
MNTTQSTSFLDFLNSSNYILSDGATGSYLQQHGLEPGDSPERMNLSSPKIITTMAKEYFDAGSDMVLTNSFGGNKFMLKKYKLLDQLDEINIQAAGLAKSVASKNQWVVGSIGPTGEFLEPLGPCSKTEMYEAFAEQSIALKNGGADAILFETMTDLNEIQIGIKAAKENTSLPVLATMTFDKGPKGYFTMMGISPIQAAMQLNETKVDVIGSNCGNGIEQMVIIAKILRDATTKNILIHSNAGMPIIQKGKTVYPESPDFMSNHFIELIKNNIKIIGGCCGTTPEHIAYLKQELTTTQWRNE